MTTTKKTQVVMLPTNEKANVGNNVIVKHNTTLAYGKKIQEPYNMAETEQHLYFLSDEEIKEGDWVLINGCIVRQCKETNKEPHTIPTVIDTIGGIHHIIVCKKIIATTDSSLIIGENKGKSLLGTDLNKYLPQPSQDFIKVFVEEYNKGNVIEWVDVEYEAMNTTIVNRNYNDFEPKVNSKNEITITMIKENWNREEVIAKLKKLAEDIDDAYRSYTSDNIIGFNMVNNDGKWISENL